MTLNQTDGEHFSAIAASSYRLRLDRDREVSHDLNRLLDEPGWLTNAMQISPKSGLASQG